MPLKVSLNKVTVFTPFASSLDHESSNIAQAVGIYEAIWHPEEIGATVAKDLITPLQLGLVILKGDTERFYNHRDFTAWVEEYLAACRKHPDAVIQINL